MSKSGYIKYVINLIKKHKWLTDVFNGILIDIEIFPNLNNVNYPEISVPSVYYKTKNQKNM